MAKSIVTKEDIRKVATLANLDLQENELDKFASQFTSTLEIVDQLSEIDTSDVQATYQVGPQSSVFREDIIDQKRMFTQKQALSGAKRTYNGFFVVNRILESK